MKCNMYKIFFTLGLAIFFSVNGMAQDSNDSKGKIEKVEKEEKKDVCNYSKEEFHSAVMIEVNRQVKRLGGQKIADLFQELLEREKKVHEEIAKVKTMNGQLDVSTKALEKKIKEFEKSQSDFISCVNVVEGKKNERVGHMVKTIKGMRPANAAEVLSVQEPEIAIIILEQLPSENVSKIFNFMDKEISARLQKQFMNMKR